MVALKTTNQQVVMDTTQIGQRIRRLRQHKGYSQEWMAGKLQISQTAYNRLETGNVEKVKPDVYCSIAELLETDVSALMSPEQGPSFYNCNQWGEIGIIHKHSTDATDFLKVIATQMEALQQQIALLNTLLLEQKKRDKS